MLYGTQKKFLNCNSDVSDKSNITFNVIQSLVVSAIVVCYWSKWLESLSNSIIRVRADLPNISPKQKRRE